MGRTRPSDRAATNPCRFDTKDREDAQLLGDAGDLDVATLRERLDSAFAFGPAEDEYPQRNRAYSNLRRVIEYLERNRRQL